MQDECNVRSIPKAVPLRLVEGDHEALGSQSIVVSRWLPNEHSDAAVDRVSTSSGSVASPKLTSSLPMQWTLSGPIHLIQRTFSREVAVLQISLGPSTEDLLSLGTPQQQISL